MALYGTSPFMCLYIYIYRFFTSHKIPHKTSPYLTLAPAALPRPSPGSVPFREIRRAWSLRSDGFHSYGSSPRKLVKTGCFSKKNAGFMGTSITIINAELTNEYNGLMEIFDGIFDEIYLT